MKKMFCLAVAGALVAQVASAQFVINNGTGAFAPSFRGSASTTWFGWGSGSFDGASNNELIDNPATTIGTAPGGVSLTQSPGYDILSSGNNIYTGTGFMVTDTDLLVSVPTVGTVGAGFTTIIVQGKTAFGAFGAEPLFGLVGGSSATYASGFNLAGAGQFWAKYEIAGNQSIYNLAITLTANTPGPISIAELQFDTYWSATSFAPDTAVVPEPSTLALVGLGGFASLILKRRSRQA